ncbi:hypothetical protein BDR06DRAFT_875403 [Suillus hirtellus]|nr:hypothetical protein BDR06DRAFT_875403 [Suillus hirtellus]
MTTRSVLTLPNPGTKAAPAKFKGGFSEVKDFLKHYEKLCDYHNVTSDEEKCESITQYMSCHVTEFIEGLLSFRSNNWSKLKADILRYYDADLDTKRYRHKDLLSYVRTTRGKKIPTLTAWKKYVRGFIHIAGWLEQAKKFTSEEYASYFWEGIYKKLHIKIETRLMAKDPDRDLSEAFPVDRVVAIAEKLLHHDRFDADLLVSEVETESETDSSTEENSDANTDSESSESETEFFHKKKKAPEPKDKKEVKKAQKKVKGHIKEAKTKTSSKDTKSPSITSPEPMDEMEGLIKRLNAISLNDPDYALYYYRTT